MKLSIWKHPDTGKWYIAVNEHVIVCENAEWCQDALECLAERIVERKG